MVSALACRIRGREFESDEIHFPQNQIIFFISLSFLLICLNFEVKQCANIYWKYDNNGFAMEKKPNFFIFQNGKYPTQGQNKTHCVVIKLSIQGTMFLSRWRWPCTWWEILYKGKRNALWFWQHFGRTITLAVFDIPVVSTESQVLYSLIIKVRMDTPIFYFRIFLWYHCTLILHTHNLAEKIFCGILFSKFLTCDYFLFFVSSSSIADSGTVWLDTYIKIIVICRDIHRTLRKL